MECLAKPGWPRPAPRPRISENGDNDQGVKMVALLTYKNYVGVLQCDQAGKGFHGRVLNITDEITFAGQSVEEVRKSFHDSLDDYLDSCARELRPPAPPLDGRLCISLPVELHQRLALTAYQKGLDPADWVAQLLQWAVENEPEAAPRLGANGADAPSGGA